LDLAFFDCTQAYKLKQSGIRPKPARVCGDTTLNIGLLA